MNDTPLDKPVTAFAPRVKPLEWEDCYGDFLAQTPLMIKIRVGRSGSGYFFGWSVCGDSDTPIEGPFTTEQAAKNAAQREYERLILGALESADTAPELENQSQEVT